MQRQRAECTMCDPCVTLPDAYRSACFAGACHTSAESGNQLEVVSNKFCFDPEYFFETSSNFFLRYSIQIRLHQGYINSLPLLNGKRDAVATLAEMEYDGVRIDVERIVMLINRCGCAGSSQTTALGRCNYFSPVIVSPAQTPSTWTGNARQYQQVLVEKVLVGTCSRR